MPGGGEQVIATVLRRSRKLRRCSCGTLIHPGAQYLEHRVSPGHDGIWNTHWITDAECRACAVRYGRWPIPNGGIEQI